MDIQKAVDSEKMETIKLLGKLIEKNTTNPPGNEWRAAEVVMEFFRKNKIEYKIFEKEKGRTNILGYIGKGKPRLIIACHLDVVPAGDGWETDPFKAKISKGNVYGRGAVDNKGPMASVLIAGKILKGFEKELKGQIVLACVADEERGSKHGLKFLLEEGKLEGEYAIVPDIGNELMKIDIAEKGLLFLKVTSFGKQAHGSRPEEGVNAIWNMVEFLNLLKEYVMKYSKHPFLSDPTGNLGVIKGGEAVNIVPDKCEVLLDFRYLPLQDIEEFLNDVKGMFREVRKKNKEAKFRLEIMENRKPVEIKKDNVLVKLIKKHAKTVIFKEPVTFGVSGTTLVKPLVKKGILAVGYSPGKPIEHVSNEYISVKQITDFSKILCMICLEMLS
jgi:acetylornithine deacetylase/succinyl-diaminopimelate desuccinylase family protein